MQEKRYNVAPSVAWGDPATRTQHRRLREEFDLTPAFGETIGSAARRINFAYGRRRLNEAFAAEQTQSYGGTA